MHDADSDTLSADLSRLVERTLSRRRFLQGSSLGLAAFLGGGSLTALAGTARTDTLLDFAPVPASSADEVRVPEGYRVEPLISWGDPILPGAPAFDASGNSSADDQAGQFGDNTDGMSLFPLEEDRALLVVNNEYVNNEFLFAHGGKPRNAEEVRKSQAAHGVSIFEIVRDGGTWKVDPAGAHNRRITANTPMDITGPAAGHPLLKTAADPAGRRCLGTFNNCANGETPWGTYLTCEENFHNYFGTANPEHPRTAAQKRYGIKNEDKRFGWSLHDARFDFAANPNEANRFGWVVEIDPMDPSSVPRKRTALGRFKHENAALIVDRSGHVVVYLGDDERGEHLYRFVSRDRYDADNPAGNRELLADGTLYVAVFDGDASALKGKGRWVALRHGENGLTPGNGFADQGEVLIHARLAATAVGATTMDRPEWVAIHPDGKTAYCALTNNKHRGVKTDQPLNGPNPRVENHYGQIVRWQPSGGDHTADQFDWDLFVLAGNPGVHQDARRGTPNVDTGNMFNGPDGIGFDPAGRLWIQTDGNYRNAGDFAGMGNNQMLCADPRTGEIRRFMTGPVACEITGLCFSPDHKTMFVGIQHPGEKGMASSFPQGGGSKPRSTIVMVTRDDGRSFAV
jgi:secreted PhoX family phosphatase